jgi:hypothetical protein
MMSSIDRDANKDHVEGNRYDRYDLVVRRSVLWNEVSAAESS